MVAICRLMGLRAACACLALCGFACPSAQSLYAVPPPVAASANANAARSPVLDPQAAAAQRWRQQPAYVESITVEGVDPDARRRPAKSVEQRFADALLAPPPAPTAGLRFLDTTPCMSVQSTWNNLGNSYAPITGCP